MEQKTKFIILGLVGLAIVGFVLFFQMLTVKQQLIKERDELDRKSVLLNNKASELDKQLRESRGRAEALDKELNRLNREKQDVERKYEIVIKEKDSLAEKLKARPVETAVAAQPQITPQTTDAYWAQILKSKTDLELQLNSLRDELRSAQVNNEQLQREKNNLILDINSLSREKEEFARRLEYNQKVTDSISQELVRERNDKIQVQESIKSLKNENTLLTRQLKGLNERKAALEKKLQKLSEEKNSVSERLDSMETMLTDKANQINSLKNEIDLIRGVKPPPAEREAKKESIELPSIVVKPGQGQAKAPSKVPVTGPEGKIIAINRENNFVIIDLGEDSGLKSADSLEVYRNGRPVAELEVLQTRKNITACDIKKEAETIQIGDTVK